MQPTAIPTDCPLSWLALFRKVCVDHIKEKLRDKSLSIAEVFSFCGEDSRGAFARTLKKLTGMTPKEYRNSLK
jgi:AraC-like DNA-binding protein